MGGICSYFKERSGQEFAELVEKNEETDKTKRKTVRFKEAVKVIKTSDSWNCEKCKKEIKQPRFRTVAPDTDSTLNQAIQKLLRLPNVSSE